MSGNPTPWIIIAALVLVSLYLKGYFRLPAAKLAPGNPANVLTPSTLQVGPPADIDALVKQGSYVLGLAYAKAVRLDAEANLAGKIARDAYDAIHKQFTDPFSPPAPAPPQPSGGAPTP